MQNTISLAFMIILTCGPPLMMMATMMVMMAVATMVAMMVTLSAERSNLGSRWSLLQTCNGLCGAGLLWF